MSQRNMRNQQKEELQKKQKRQKMTATVLVIVVVLAVVGGIGWTVYDSRRQQKEARKEAQEQIERSRQETNAETVNVDPIREYLSTLDTELLNKDIAPESEKMIVTTSQAVTSEGDKTDDE